MSNKRNEEMPEQQVNREEEVRLAAYYLWEQKGRRIGCEVEDWLEAEQCLMQ
ncbi:DUF2934 domain-containing protein [Pelodictyon luteolum]|uniref:DUF2934 domain-containing protein n=1 Tax=Pelodictyon luteolum TaxID=1100 RepID=UPI0002E2F579|nr:DUF2934 domain-containing protein [Pelodictyon luteolum]